MLKLTTICEDGIGRDISVQSFAKIRELCAYLPGGSNEYTIYRGMIPLPFTREHVSKFNGGVTRIVDTTFDYFNIKNGEILTIVRNFTSSDGTC